MNATTTNERVQKMRAEREALGLKRLELYAHPDDWPARSKDWKSPKRCNAGTGCIGAA